MQSFRYSKLILIGCIFFLWMLQSYYLPLSQFINRNNCSTSLIESDDLICESDELWNERKILYQIQDEENMMKRRDLKFFRSNWEPNFHCSHSRRIGKMGDGGKWVCDLFPLKTRSNCLIYSADSGDEFSFEIDMKTSMPHCEIHTFDKKLFNCPNNTCIFHQTTWGNGKVPKGSKTWTMIVKELKHTNRLIDILKIDIEGAEYEYFPLLFQSAKTSFPRQILVELHPRSAPRIHKFFEKYYEQIIM